jgi:histidinol dehydrogenase
MMLRRIDPSEIGAARREVLDAKTCAEAAAIVDDVRMRGEKALIDHGRRLGDWSDGEPVVLDRNDLEAGFAQVSECDRELLERAANRIRTFASAQRRAISDMSIAVNGGRAGHTIEPVERAACYAPGKLFPTPSSVLMTALTARAAGVREVWVASPRPAPITIAAAFVAGADALLTIGGAQAIAAFAYGAGRVPACDAIVGPGTRWVAAAKQCVAGRVTIDVFAGPSELVVLADASADPSLIAADLLAQAEHDEEALPVLIALDAKLVDAVERELERQLATLPTAETARRALANGFAVIETDLRRAIQACDDIAPEHLQISLRDPHVAAYLVRHCGAVCVGSKSAKVLGDYGAGPNHVLPTSRGARSRAGLSVLTFLRVRTWLEMEDPSELAVDAAAFARLEGFEAHARAAERRGV